MGVNHVRIKIFDFISQNIESRNSTLVSPDRLVWGTKFDFSFPRQTCLVSVWGTKVEFLDSLIYHPRAREAIASLETEVEFLDSNTHAQGIRARM